jgi:hypothetical protein
MQIGIISWEIKAKTPDQDGRAMFKLTHYEIRAKFAKSAETGQSQGAMYGSTGRLPNSGAGHRC